MEIPRGKSFEKFNAVRHSMSEPLFRFGIQRWVKAHQLPVFAACCALITLIGVLDTWLVIKYSGSIYEMEENPICLMLIRQDPYGLMVFVYGKAIGLIMVNSVLIGLFRYWRRVALTITFGVTLFQIYLLSYLYVWSDIPHFCRVYLD